MSDAALIAAMVERLRETDPWRNWKCNATFERQCEALLPVVREQVEREIVAYLDQLDAARGETNLLAWAARRIEKGDHRG